MLKVGQEKIRIAAFDLDGTILDGESPLILTRNLLGHHQLPLHTGVKMGAWGIRYRLRLPQDERLPRELLFTAFKGMTVEEADAKILEVYRVKIASRIKAAARAEIKACSDEGLVPILASASFKPITTAVVDELGFAGHVSTIMEEREGRYTARVQGAPVQGPEKLKRLNAYCNGVFGTGAWQLERAYGDHFSDITLLAAAKHPVAVDPDGLLSKVAGLLGWEVVRWED